MLDVRSFWEAFQASAHGVAQPCIVVSFGDGEAMADELAALVTGGRKRATASLHRHYVDGDERLPQAGDCFVVTDGRGEPCCVCRTVEVRIGPLSSVDAAFAFDEGEGDRSLSYWLEAHRAFFGREAAAGGFTMDDGLATVFERFEVVWPPALRSQP